ncbi:hypothetical protein ACWD5R_43655 [Streptomyces sp. NPDC002514]|uniref:hypothetical protein n=1 Tax=Streptomyces sp. NPDC001270 TaxID=3364554 RepID=UPI00367D2D34
MPKLTNPKEVTEILKEFLRSDQSLRKFAKSKNIKPNTFYSWAKGATVPGGRAGLEPEDREKLDDRLQEKRNKTDPQEVTEILKEFLHSGQSLPEFAKSKKASRATFYNWAKGVTVPGGRAGLEPEDREKLDDRLQEKRNKADPQEVTEILKEFLHSDLSLPEFAKSKKVSRLTVRNWAGGIAVPGGRAGLEPEDREKLDDRLRENVRDEDDFQEVTEILKEFLNSDQTMQEFVTEKDLNRSTFYNWAKGVRVPGGRAGLEPEEQVKLDDRLREKSRRGPRLELGVAGTGVGAAVEDMPQAAAGSPAAAVPPQQASESYTQPSLAQYATAGLLAMEGPAGALGSTTLAAAAADRPRPALPGGLSSFGANNRTLPPPFPSSAVSSDYLHGPGTPAPAPVSGNSKGPLPQLPDNPPRPDSFFGHGGSQGQARGGR